MDKPGYCGGIEEIVKSVYFQETWRFSHDLDFTALHLDLDSKDIRNQLESIFRDIEGKYAIKLVFKLEKL